MKVYAFVPARSGSAGLPDKNILPIDGRPLMAYAIAFGRSLGVDRVIVSTDSRRYADIAESWGAEVPCLRGPEASTGTAMEEDIIADMARTFPPLGVEMPDIWIRLKPTNPFRRAEAVHRALGVLRERAEVDSVRIVSKTESRLTEIGPDGWLRPASPHWDPARSVMRRTEFPTAYSPFNLDVLRHACWERLGPGYMGRRILPIVEHAITGMDINDREDFELIRTMIEMRPRPELIARHLPDDRFL